MTSKNTKAILFDLDGTLLDTIEDLCDSLNRVLVSFGFPAHSLADYRYFVGEGAGILVERALPEDKRNTSVQKECLKAFKADYAENWNQKTRLFEGISDMLDGLSKKGLALTILSNKPQRYTELCYEGYLSSWDFKIVFGQREGIPRKPDPAGAIEIAEKLKLDPSEFLYLGDTPIDMLTAQRAQMHSVGVSWGFRPVEQLIEAGAKTIIRKPTELLGLLGGD